MQQFSDQFPSLCFDHVAQRNVPGVAASCGNECAERFLTPLIRINHLSSRDVGLNQNQNRIKPLKIFTSEMNQKYIVHTTSSYSPSMPRLRNLSILGLHLGGFALCQLGSGILQGQRGMGDYRIFLWSGEDFYLGCQSKNPSSLI